MKPVVGVFKSRSAAQSAAAKLVPLGIPNDRINILTPDVTQTELAQLPTQAAEQPVLFGHRDQVLKLAQFHKQRF